MKIHASTINYNNLFYAHRIMELGSVKLASEELKLAQSTLSEHLKQVEQSLGVKLFTRGKNGLLITPEGQKLYRYTHLIFKTAERIKNIFTKEAIPKRKIDVGVLPSVINSRTSKFLLPLFEQKDGLIRVHQADSQYLIKSFIHGELDIFLSDYKVDLPLLNDLHSEFLGSINYVLVYNPRFEAVKQTLQEDSGAVPFLHFSVRSETRWLVEQYFSKRNLKLDVKGESDDVELLKGVIMNIPSCAVLPTSIIQDELMNGTLEILDEAPIGTTALYASYLKNDGIESIEEAILRLKKAIIGPSNSTRHTNQP